MDAATCALTKVHVAVEGTPRWDRPRVSCSDGLLSDGQLSETKKRQRPQRLLRSVLESELAPSANAEA